MNTIPENITRSAPKAWKSLLLLAFIIGIASPAFAQNTKGDKPASQAPLIRLPKIKSKHKGGDRAYTGDISGRRIRTKNKSSANRVIYKAPDPYAKRKRSKITDHVGQPMGRIYNTPPREGKRTGRGLSFSFRIRSSSASRARNNVYSQRGPYVNNSARRPRSKVKVYTLPASGLPIIPHPPGDPQRAGRGNSRGPASASSSFLIRGRKNVYWGKFSKGERPVTHDLTGRPLLKLNFHSAGIGVGTSDTLKVARQKPKKQGALSGNAKVGFRTASKRGERAWSGDVSGHAIRKRSPKTGSNGVYLSERQPSGSARPDNRALPARTPGIGAGSIARVLRKLTGRRTIKGGGTSGKSWNNDRRPIDVRAPGAGAIGMGNFRGNFHQGELSPGFSHAGSGFSGNIKSRRQPKGGGSISGKYLNNNGRPIDVRAPGIGSQGIGRFQGNFRRGDLLTGFSHAGAGYSGNIKSGRPPKGGGSISGKFLNNNGRPIDVRAPGIGSQGIGRFQGSFRRGDLLTGFSHAGAGYSGNIRSRRPLKGGGSVSGKGWNNDNNPIQVKGGALGFDRAARYRGDIPRYETDRDFGQQGYGFSGNIKTRKPKKGGGSISERIFNNNGHSINVHEPGLATAKASRFSGNYRAKRNEKGGGSISGKLLNNDGKPIDPRLPSSAQAKDVNYSGNIRGSRFKRNYVQNPKASDQSIKKKKPNATTYLVEGLTVKNKQGTYKKKPQANDHALPGIGPNKQTVKASEYSQAMKMYWSYKHNPSSNDHSLKVVAPGKGYVRASEYSQAMKMYWSYKHNPSSNDHSLKVVAPGKGYVRASEYSQAMKMDWSYKHNPSSNDHSLKVRAPGEGYIRAGEYSQAMKMNWSYKHNPSSNDRSLNVIAPGKAYARIADFQGNMKMKKYNDKRLHPDAQFAHGSRDNVKADRTLMMNIKLIWAKLFRKNDTQPEVVKTKEHRPRYDKKEKELWKALYD